MAQIIPLFKRMAQKEPDKESWEGRKEKFFSFSMGDKAFVVPAVDVAEVAAFSSLIEIPTNSEIVSGVVNVRGTVIPIINLRKRLGLPKDFEIESKTKAIYFKPKQDFFIGMIVDNIDFRLTEGIILPKSASLGDSNNNEEVIMEEKDTNCRFKVFLIDDLVKPDEFEEVQKVLEAF
ncbi:MAG: chemotaxis protein CheW [Candidatus Riflebacteria bacterium]|nr:chemotaxis protein CheW [Candidatus Riflebacteria bacterium]